MINTRIIEIDPRELKLLKMIHNTQDLELQVGLTHRLRAGLIQQPQRGRSKIPVGSAKVIKKALDRMVGHGDITNKNLWEGLEYLCADYLGGD